MQRARSRTDRHRSPHPPPLLAAPWSGGAPRDSRARLPRHMRGRRVVHERGPPPLLGLPRRSPPRELRGPWERGTGEREQRPLSDPLGPGSSSKSSGWP
eukprot:6725771-Alexandrium_andersonii.AAC.1